MDVVYSVECLSCCCCPSNESPGDNPASGSGATVSTSGGLTTITITGNGNGAGGSVTVEWDVCFLGCGFAFIDYPITVTNGTGDPIVFRVQIANNFENITTGTLGAGSSTSFTMSLYNVVSCPNDCNCVNPLLMCTEVIGVMTINWAPDPQAAYAPALGGGLSAAFTTTPPPSFTLVMPDDGGGGGSWLGMTIALLDSTCFSFCGAGGLADYTATGVLDNGDGTIDVTMSVSSCQACPGCGGGFSTVEKVPDPPCVFTSYSRYMQCYGACAPKNTGVYDPSFSFLIISSGGFCYYQVFWSFTMCLP
jgi:hypothetical protein